MDDITEGFLTGFAVAVCFAVMIFMTPLIDCRSNFEREAIGNECGKLICDINGTCEFEWTCSE